MLKKQNKYHDTLCKVFVNASKTLWRYCSCVDDVTVASVAGNCCGSRGGFAFAFQTSGDLKVFLSVGGLTLSGGLGPALRGVTCGSRGCAADGFSGVPACCCSDVAAVVVLRACGGLTLCMALGWNMGDC